MVSLSPIICMYSENLKLKSLNGTFDCNYILSLHISYVCLADNTFQPLYPYSSIKRIWTLKRHSCFIVSSNPIMPTKNQTLLFLCINIIFVMVFKFYFPVCEIFQHLFESSQLINNHPSYCNVFLIVYNDIFGTASFCDMTHSNGLRLTLSHDLYLHSSLCQSLIYLQINNATVSL